MDETSPRDLRAVRDLLERATVPEPPIGPMAHNALRAGLRLRRRRRAQGAAIAAAAVSAVCAAALAVAGAAGHSTATPASGTATVYVLGGSMTRGTVTPISTATNTPGKPIVVRSGNAVDPNGLDMAITPNGKTIWVSAGSDTVTPISTATKTAGKPIKVVHQPGQFAEQVVITPDGKTVYVLDSSGAVTPISAATNMPGKPIELRQAGGAYSYQSFKMAITPDGKTLYVAVAYLTGPSYVIPIATATNTPGKPIRLETIARDIVVTPDGKTAYAV
jgi:DNA-binding beta-propeller fold protein YncE